MKQYLKHDEWKIIEEGLNPHYNKISESVFSLGNGRMGQRATFEEDFSGETHQGSYVAGVYYPDKTRVGWWKNGYPEYFAKVLNAPSWIEIKIQIGSEVLDIAKCQVENFVRVLDMKQGLLHRSFSATLPSGKKVKVDARRFCSMADGEIGAIRYEIVGLNFSSLITITLPVDADVVNKDSNYDEKFWDEVYKGAEPGTAIVTAETRKTLFHVTTGITYQIMDGGKPKAGAKITTHLREKYADNKVELELKEGTPLTVYKYAVVLSSENHPKERMVEHASTKLKQAASDGFDKLFAAHAKVWNHKWEECDITIDGDVAAQQGIRFNIFQLTQTYTGEDQRLNIGPKGFTGEKYGGSTYWDTEAYCLPFFLSTAEEKVARNLLVYRYKHLPKAIENAQKLGFTDGAAFYPFVTMNGEECHNEWEITFEEIHRTSAMAYAIRDYVDYTGDTKYFEEYGLEVLIGIARYWSQRVNWSNDKNKYVVLGVTGPNEYENNVNNNWYTNYLGAWTLRFARHAIDHVKNTNPARFQEIVSKTNFNETETIKWKDISEKMYYPYDTKRNVILQQDGFLDKELMRVNDLRPQDRPLNQKWSWDRILRSCFIKQADVLQGIYLFEDDFDLETIRRNFDFYEPMTVHESSLSPCVHVILASKLGYKEQAYKFYLRTARLDLDDYNNDTEEGCHITSMAGTWMSVVKGFGGMRIRNGKLYFTPYLPEQWKSYSFRLEFRGRVLKVRIAKDNIETILEQGEPLEIVMNGTPVLLK